MTFGTGTPATAEERLAAVRNAMHTLMTGGAISEIERGGGGGAQKHFDLKSMMELENNIIREIANSHGRVKNKVEYR